MLKSLSPKRQSQSVEEEHTKKKQRKETRKEGGIKQKMEHKWEGTGRDYEQKRQIRKSTRKDVGEMKLGESENEFIKLERLLSGSDFYAVNCSLPPRQSALWAQCNAITHLFGPKAFVSLGAVIKAPSAWKCGITDRLLQGPVAWPFSKRFTTQAVNHTHHIVTHSSNASLLSSLRL